jgi:thiopeptide-type bacteriocin biosynthesis protein
LFLKLYSPRTAQDDLIAGPIRTFCLDVKGIGLADEWFFVRYFDPDPHVRIRFRGVPETLVRDLLPRVCDWTSRLVVTGKSQKVVFDTYDREVERYGGPEGTSASESVFAIDSAMVTEILASAPRVERAFLAVMCVDYLLGALGLDEQMRLAWLKSRVTWRNEVGDEYRARRTDLITALSDPTRLNAAIIDVFGRYQEPFAVVSRKLNTLESSHVLTQPLSSLYGSYVHMHCNRLTLDQTVERRVLGLLLRAREAVSHRRGRIADWPTDTPVAVRA